MLIYIAEINKQDAIIKPAEITLEKIKQVLFSVFKAKDISENKVDKIDEQIENDIKKLKQKKEKPPVSIIDDIDTKIINAWIKAGTPVSINKFKKDYQRQYKKLLATRKEKSK